MKQLKLVFVILLFVVNGYSQKEEIKFERISTHEGLSEGVIMSIIQDRKGFMWFATYDGLNRYDGNEFKIFKNNQKDTNSLSNNTIRAIYEECDGVLWVGTYDGLNKYTRSTGSF